MKLVKILSSPLLLLLLFLFHPVKVAGQALPIPPDCVVFINQAVTTGTTIDIPSTAGFSNRTIGCQTWTFTYQANATSGTFTSVGLQSANGAVTAGTFNNWPGTVNFGINPNTDQSNATTVLSTGCLNAVECTVDNSWVRIHLIRNSFVGTINGVLYGYRTGPVLNVSATVIPAGTQDVNLIEVGGVAVLTGGVNGSQGVGGVAAAAATMNLGNPVQEAGIDEAGAIRRISTDTGGRQIPSSASSAAADAINNTEVAPLGVGAGILYPRVFGLVFNGTTWDRVVGNTSGTAPTNASSSGADTVSNTELTPTAVGGGILYPRVFGLVFNGTTWDRMRGNTSGIAPANASSANADGVSNTELNYTDAAGTNIFARNFHYNYNGTTWDRVPGNTSGTAPTNASSADADALSNTELTHTSVGNTVLYPRVMPRVYNGTTWDRQPGNTAGAFVQGSQAIGATPAQNPLFIYRSGNGASAVASPIICGLQAVVTVAAASTTSVIGAVGGQLIRICGFVISQAANGTFQFISGTGGSCGTGTASLTGAFPTQAGVPFPVGVTISPIFTANAASDEVCIVTTGTNANVAGVISFARF